MCLREAICDCPLEPVEGEPLAGRAVGAWPTSALRVCVIASTARPDGRLDRPRWLREFFNGLPGLYPPARWLREENHSCCDVHGVGSGRGYSVTAGDPSVDFDDVTWCQILNESGLRCG